MPVAAGNGRCPLPALWGAIGNGELTKAPSGPSRDPAHMYSPLRFGHEQSNQLIRRSKIPFGETRRTTMSTGSSFRPDHGKAEGRRYYGEWNGREAKLNQLNRTGPTAQTAADSPLRFTPHKAGVVADAQVGAGLAAFDMTAQRRRSAALNRRHDLQLAEAHVAGVGRTPRRPAVAEDVRHLDRRPRHRPRVSQAS
jgi:hypothetical protein